tara:strand:- start:470 stop:769 length:300 start_codon:yes stop_codon:yes gene_type:complete
MSEITYKLLDAADIDQAKADGLIILKNPGAYIVQVTEDGRNLEAKGTGAVSALDGQTRAMIDSGQLFVLHEQPRKSVLPKKDKAKPKDGDYDSNPLSDA